MEHILSLDIMDSFNNRQLRRRLKEEETFLYVHV